MSGVVGRIIGAVVSDTGKAHFIRGAIVGGGTAQAIWSLDDSRTSSFDQRLGMASGAAALTAGVVSAGLLLRGVQAGTARPAIVAAVAGVGALGLVPTAFATAGDKPTPAEGVDPSGEAEFVEADDVEAAVEAFAGELEAPSTETVTAPPAEPEVVEEQAAPPEETADEQSTTTDVETNEAPTEEALSEEAPSTESADDSAPAPADEQEVVEPTIEESPTEAAPVETTSEAPTVDEPTSAPTPTDEEAPTPPVDDLPERSTPGATTIPEPRSERSRKHRVLPNVVSPQPQRAPRTQGRQTPAPARPSTNDRPTTIAPSRQQAPEVASPASSRAQRVTKALPRSASQVDEKILAAVNPKPAPQRARVEVTHDGRVRISTPTPQQHTTVVGAAIDFLFG
jgi:hypothetical protein